MAVYESRIRSLIRVEVYHLKIHFTLAELVESGILLRVGDGLCLNLAPYPRSHESETPGTRLKDSKTR